MHREWIRGTLSAHGRLPVRVEELADDADLYEAGLTSLGAMGVLLAIERHFQVEFPDALLAPSTFRTIDSLAAALDGLLP